MKPLVSAVILNHNYGRYLPDAVESVLAQDFSADELEILVVDNASTDDSVERLAPYLGRVRLVPNTDSGQVHGFHVGMREASGEWIALLEADDLWVKGKLRKTLERLRQEPEAAMAQHWMLQVDDQKRPLPGYTYPPGPDRFGLDDLLACNMAYAGTSCLVFDARRIKPFLPFPESALYGADICLRYAAVLLGPILNIPETLALRRIHGANTFGESILESPEKLEQALPFHNTLVDYCFGLLEQHGIRPDPAYRESREYDRLQMELFLARYRWKLADACRAWARLLRRCGLRPYTLFKGGSLLIALASPALYLFLQRFYGRSAALQRLRRSLLPS